MNDPQGWAPGEPPGSVGYDAADLRPLERGPVLMAVSRFTAVKRLPLLIEAYAEARERFTRRAPLVLVGGHPGEWEGEHPYDAVRRTGAPDVFLAGWQPHDALADFFSAADVVVLPSVREQFGQVLMEGMACALPALAVDAHGPATIVDDPATGWLVPGDDRAALADALVAAVADPVERRARGERARASVIDRYALSAIAEQVAGVYDATVSAPTREAAAAATSSA